MNVASVTMAEKSNTRVMLVEDSAVVRGMIRGWLEGMAGVDVVAAADNGQVALNKVAAAKPDIIILDIEMPVMDGLTALPGLLRSAPGVKVLIASTLSRRNAEVTLKAMHLGAADYLAKPSFAKDGVDARAVFRDELIGKISGLAGLVPIGENAPEKVAHIARSGIKKAPSSVPAPNHQRWGVIPPPDTKFSLRKASKITPRILAIGSSTGGPAALSKMLGELKGRLNHLPVLVTQHMPPTFTTLLGESLCRLTGLLGGEAKEGDEVLPGHLYVAPGGFHMRLKQVGGKSHIALEDGPPINHCKPAVDPMFESIAEIYRSSTLSVVLTGMGTDGALGATKIADAGGSVFAQDEKSSIVWGMPGAAMAAGACVEAIALEQLASRIGNIMLSKRA